VTTASQARSRSSAKVITLAVLVIIAILAIIAGVLYLTEPARSLPSVLGTITSPASRAGAHRDARGGVSLAVGVILLLVAYFIGRPRRPAPEE
jgi:uncharacterized membrane protein